MWVFFSTHIGDKSKIHATVKIIFLGHFNINIFEGRKLYYVDRN